MVEFDTKNQLFNHIKETGHATATTAPTGTDGSAAVTSTPTGKDDFFSSEDEKGRGKGKKGRGKRK